MNKTVHEAREFFANFKPSPHPNQEIIICPPFTLLSLAISLTAGRWSVGAQDLFWEVEGAYTGEVSGRMVRDVGCTHVIIGHSERRALFGETDASVNRKTQAALRERLIPIVCVGETLAEMEAGKTKEVLKRQILEGLSKISIADPKDLIVAYEPVWAIGTGKADTPEKSNESIGFIRQCLSQIVEKNISEGIRILYGGSVKPENIGAFMAEPEIDGGLVGGASLSAKSFSEIILNAR